MDLMMVLDELSWKIGYLWAPVHELGHCVFGWFSLNLTFPIAWDLVENAH